eukprot:1940895-Alexandrium_andersonii.AAC.1
MGKLRDLAAKLRLRTGRPSKDSPELREAIRMRRDAPTPELKRRWAKVVWRARREQRRDRLNSEIEAVVRHLSAGRW